MLRSPFFYVVIILSFISCKEKTPALIKPNISKKTAKLMQEKALNELEKSNYNSSFYYFNKSKVIFEAAKDSSNIVFNLLQMATIQQINGDYYGSKETLTEALPFSKGNTDYGVAINNLFGIADKELSVLLQGNRLIPIIHGTTYAALREVSPMLASRSGLDTLEDTMPEIAAKIAELVEFEP